MILIIFLWTLLLLLSFFGTHGALFNKFITKNMQNTMEFKRRHSDFEHGCVYRTEVTLQMMLSCWCFKLVTPCCYWLTNLSREIFFLFLFGKFFLEWFVHNERHSWKKMIKKNDVHVEFFSFGNIKLLYFESFPDFTSCNSLWP